MLPTRNPEYSGKTEGNKRDYDRNIMSVFRFFFAYASDIFVFVDSVMLEFTF